MYRPFIGNLNVTALTKLLLEYVLPFFRELIDKGYSMKKIIYCPFFRELSKNKGHIFLEQMGHYTRFWYLLHMHIVIFEGLDGV